MPGRQIAMIAAGAVVIVACVGVIATSRGLARTIYEASWGRLGVPFRPRLARMGIIGAGVIGVLIGAGVVVLALTIAAS
ncbi:hypothetical protein EDF23_101471 [Curtobacterium sp. PhB128]|nr:hypothetical protein EDF23_101471 [Curtobacterium sp. PhB128]TCL99153.1 hypothetical protein EDF29_101472 [Curtobacterium sp. PhB138]TCU84275.1 hypothetical protein EDF48_10693 [Curtobacterium sp. PhB191]